MTFSPGSPRLHSLATLFGVGSRQIVTRPLAYIVTFCGGRGSDNSRSDSCCRRTSRTRCCDSASQKPLRLACPFVFCFQGPATRRVPSQCQMRDLGVPLLSGHWNLPVGTGAVSRMSGPTAVTAKVRTNVGDPTSCQSPPLKLKTAQPLSPHVPGVVAMTMAWLPGPTKAPQNDWATESPASSAAR